ncbi:hypothetical protein CBA19C8_19225 [Paraburkholderia terrae]|nr:hypothetical protein [Paraburkholderia terrae]GJH02724.1 hypothetical protein CBA19C8_19225 [Paraburkholderia terrae]
MPVVPVRISTCPAHHEVRQQRHHISRAFGLRAQLPNHAAARCLILAVSAIARNLQNAIFSNLVRGLAAEIGIETANVARPRVQRRCTHEQPAFDIPAKNAGNMPILEIGRMTQILCFVENDQIKRVIGNGLIVRAKARTIRHQGRDTPAVCLAQCVREVTLLRL